MKKRTAVIFLALCLALGGTAAVGAVDVPTSTVQDFILMGSVLSFETNGGEAVADVAALAGEKVDLTAVVPVKEGCTFAGWYADAALTEAVTEINVYGHKTVYAAWTEASAPISDIENAKYAEDIKDVVGKSLMTVDEDGRFAPETELTRADAVKVIWKIAGSPVVDFAMDFTDVAEDADYAEAVRWAEAEKIVSGVAEGTFAPDETVTREQVAAMIYRYVQTEGGGFTGDWYFPLTYDDIADIDEWADEGMHWVTMNMLFEATDNNIAPDAAVTKGDAAHAFAVLAQLKFENDAAKEIPDDADEDVEETTETTEETAETAGETTEATEETTEATEETTEDTAETKAE